MTYWLTENSTVPMVTGAILAVILFFMAFSARDRLLGFVALGVAILTIATVLCERMIVTDWELITEKIYVLADHVENNNTDGILEHISKKHPELAARAAGEMKNVKFESCRLLGTNYFVGPESGNEQAEICFVVVATGAERRGARGTANFKVILNFERESEDNWKIIEYDHKPATAGLNL